jgi:hypothetical protein
VGFEVLTAVFSSGVRCCVFRYKFTNVSEEMLTSSGSRSELREQQASRVQSSGVTCFHAGFLPGLFFNPEDGGDTFLRNAG